MSYHGVTDDFRVRLLSGGHNFTTDSFRLALYEKPLPRDLAAYTTQDEATGVGYMAGGKLIEVSADHPKMVGDRAEVRFDPVVWTTGTFKATHGLIYNATHPDQPSVMILFLGREFSVTDGMTIRTPVTAPALLRI